MKKPTPDQIVAEIAAHRACKAYIPERTLFGDDNHAALDAAAEALSARISVDDAYEQAGEDEPSNEDQARIDAALWLAGDRADTLSSEWDSYKPKD